MSAEVVGLTQVFIAAGLALVFLLVRLSDASVRRTLRPIAEGLGFRHAHDGAREAPNFLVAMWRGQLVQIHYQTSSRSRRARVSISLLVPQPIESGVLFHRENTLYRFVKAVGLTREAQAIDSAFNQRVFVESENDEVVPPLIAHAGLRREVLALLDIPRSTVRLDGDGASVIIVDHLGWRRYFAPNKIEEILSHLRELSQNASSTLQPAPYELRTRSGLAGETPTLVLSEGRTFAGRLALLRHPPQLAIAVACLLTFLGPLLLLWGTRYQTISWRLHALGLGLAGVCLVFYTPRVFGFVRSRSQSHRTLATFMFAALVGFPPFFVGGRKIVNGLLDRNPPIIVEGQVLGHVRKRRELRVWVALPRQSGAVSVSVSPRQYRATLRGQLLPIIVSPGALGEPWVVRSLVD